jgi:hypothetical protein
MSRLLRTVALALVCLTASAALVYPPMTKYQLFESGFGGRYGDTGQYILMSQGTPLGQIIKPFRYRVFTPFLARLVPLPPAGLLRYFDMRPDRLITYRFGMANLLGLAVSGLLLIELCTAFSFEMPWGLLGALLFYTSFVVVNGAGAPMADAWAYAFILLGLVAAVRGSLVWLLVASLVGMFAKETTLILVPAVLLLADAPRVKLGKLAALLPGIVVYAIFRHAFSAGGYSFPNSPITAFSRFMERMSHGPYLWWILFEGATAFGLLVPLGAIGAWSLRQRPRAPLARLAWLVPATLVLPFVNAVGIGSGIGRLWFYCFPVMIPLVLLGLRRVLGAAPLPEGGTPATAAEGSS